jgi:tryptophan-rich sensory protein
MVQTSPHKIQAPRFIVVMVMIVYVIAILCITIVISLYPIWQESEIWQIVWAGAIVFLITLLVTFLLAAFGSAKFACYSSIAHFTALFFVVLCITLALIFDCIARTNVLSFAGLVLSTPLLIAIWCILNLKIKEKNQLMRLISKASGSN